jgi:transposase-like protein
MKRKHFSSEQQQTILHQWRESGLTGERFAHERGISVGTLWRWNKTWKVATSQPVFRAVTVQPCTEPVGTSAKNKEPIAELVAGKLIARLFGGAKREDIAVLVTVLQEAASC